MWRRTVEKDRNKPGWHTWGAAAALGSDVDGMIFWPVSRVLMVPMWMSE